MRFPFKPALTLAFLLATSCGGYTAEAIDANDDLSPIRPSAAATVEVPLIESYTLNSALPNVKGTGVHVGDSLTHPGHHYRGFFRFDVGALPAGATIISATFGTLRRTQLSSGNPEIALGPLYLDDFVAEGAAPVGATAIKGYTLAPNFAVLQLRLGGRHEADVTARLQSAVTAGRSKLNLRAHWYADYNDNGVSDMWYFDFPDEYGPATLTVTYAN